MDNDNSRKYKVSYNLFNGLETKISQRMQMIIS